MRVQKVLLVFRKLTLYLTRIQVVPNDRAIELAIGTGITPHRVANDKEILRGTIPRRRVFVTPQGFAGRRIQGAERI